MYIAAMVPFALIAVNWRHPILVWEEPVSGACIQAAFWFFPWVAFVGVLRQSQPVRQFLGLLSLLPLLLVSAIAIPASIMDVSAALANPNFLARQWIATVEMTDGSRLVTYKLDPCSWCVVEAELRHERTIFGPLTLVRAVTGRGGETLCVRVLDARHVLVDKESYTLRPHVVF